MKRNSRSQEWAMSLVAALWLMRTAAGQAVLPQGSGSEAQGQHTAARAAGSPADILPANAAFGDRYEIGIGDVVAINVWKDAELSRTMPVRPDGEISLPVIGEIQVAGLTTAQLQALIVSRLDPYIRNPQVNVIVQEIKSRTFNVMGKVNKPGSFDLTKPTRVLDAIALAGGFQEYAKQSRLYVLRPLPSGEQTMLPFNYKAVIKGKRPTENVQIQSGDTVVVP
jgi:polysaccharide biosynthesis/export protein